MNPTQAYDCGCNKPNIVAMGRHHVNSMCLSCGKHWYGIGSLVKEYTRKEWDALMNGEIAALAEEA